MPWIEREGLADGDPGAAQVMAQLRAETHAQRAERIQTDTDLARDLGLDRPYVIGPRVGRCPGSAGYGHGLTATAVHGDGCCQAWDRARTERIADRSPEAG